MPVNIAGYGPARVAATSTQKISIALSAVSAASRTCASCLAQVDMTASPPVVVSAPQPAVSSLSGTPLLQSDATGDRVFVAYSGAQRRPNRFVKRGITE